MPWVGFELTTPVFELSETVHALDRAANVIDNFTFTLPLIKYSRNFEKVGRSVLPQVTPSTNLILSTIRSLSVGALCMKARRWSSFDIVL
jgi:hypothetical protein